MKNRFLYLCLIILSSLLFCSCGETEAAYSTEKDDDRVVINLPTDDSVNGYRLESEEAAPEVYNGNYYANTKSKVFHREDCGSAKRISDSNRYITDNREELLSEDYSPCKNCNP